MTNSNSLLSMISGGIQQYLYQALTVVLALAFAFMLFANGQLNWQLEQTNKALNTRTQELIAAEAESATLSGAIASQNRQVALLAETRGLMKKAGDEAQQHAAQREKTLLADIERLRRNSARDCNVEGLSARITQELLPP